MNSGPITAPNEDDVTPAAEETLQFDEAPKEDDVTSAAEETLQFDEAPKEDDITSAAEGRLQFDDDNLRGEKQHAASCFLCRRSRDEKVQTVRPRPNESRHLKKN